MKRKKSSLVDYLGYDHASAFSWIRCVNGAHTNNRFHVSFIICVDIFHNFHYSHPSVWIIFLMEFHSLKANW